MIKFLTPIVLAIVLACSPVSADVPLTYSNVQPSVYKVTAMGVRGQSLWTGTAWKYAEGYFITAGHVCDGANSFKLTNRTGQEYPVINSDYIHNDDLDFCFLEAPNVPGAPLRMTLDYPELYTPVFFVGATHGIYGHDAAPAGQGLYVGGDVCTMMAAGPGASGAPVFTADGGVFGIIVSGWDDTAISNIQSLQEIYIVLSFE